MPYDPVRERQASRYALSVLAQHAQDAARRGEEPRPLYADELARRIMNRFDHWPDQNYSRARSAAQRAIEAASLAAQMRADPASRFTIGSHPRSEYIPAASERYEYRVLIVSAVEGIGSVDRVGIVRSDTPLSAHEIHERVMARISFTDSPRKSTRAALLTLPADAVVGTQVLSGYKR